MKMTAECDCDEKVVLVEGDASFIARETFCPKHGYRNSCYSCGVQGTTETCRACSGKQGIEGVVESSGGRYGVELPWKDLAMACIKKFGGEVWFDSMDPFGDFSDHILYCCSIDDKLRFVLTEKPRPNVEATVNPAQIRSSFQQVISEMSKRDEFMKMLGPRADVKQLIYEARFEEALRKIMDDPELGGPFIEYWVEDLMDPKAEREYEEKEVHGAPTKGLDRWIKAVGELNGAIGGEFDDTGYVEYDDPYIPLPSLTNKGEGYLMLLEARESDPITLVEGKWSSVVSAVTGGRCEFKNAPSDRNEEGSIVWVPKSKVE